MRPVLAFASGIVVAVLAYVAARLLGIFVWQIEPDNLFGETLLSLASGAGMGLAALSAPTWVLNVDGHGKVALASFVCVGTIVALSSALILYTLLANSAYTRDYWIILVSSVALPAGYFGVGAVVLKN